MPMKSATFQNWMLWIHLYRFPASFKYYLFPQMINLALDTLSLFIFGKEPIAEANGTLPETVISEQSLPMITMNIEKYVQVIWVSPSSGLSLAVWNLIAMQPWYCTTNEPWIIPFQKKKICGRMILQHLESENSNLHQWAIADHHRKEMLLQTRLFT